MRAIAVALALASAWFHNGRLSSSSPGAGSASASLLLPLACDVSTTCTTSLVADDWDGSSATWTDRNATNNGTKRGTPVKGVSTVFPGRSSISFAGAASCFTVPNDQYTGATLRTYEFILDDYGTGNNAKYLSARHEGSFVQLVNPFYKNNSTSMESSVYISGAGGIYLGQSGAFANTEGLPVAITLVIDMTAPSWTLYRNGVQVFQDLTSSGSLSTTGAQALGVGCRWNQSAADSSFGGKLLEFVRHDSALSAGVVLSRLTQFNALKGY